MIVIRTHICSTPNTSVVMATKLSMGLAVMVTLSTTVELMPGCCLAALPQVPCMIHLTNGADNHTFEVIPHVPGVHVLIEWVFIMSKEVNNWIIDSTAALNMMVSMLVCHN